MTFEEAELFLKNFKDPYIKNGDEWLIFIAPKTIEDRINFFSDLKHKNCSLSDVKEYSNNNDFEIVTALMKALNLA
jgi:hypothetical protein